MKHRNRFVMVSRRFVDTLDPIIGVFWFYKTRILSEKDGIPNLAKEPSITEYICVYKIEYAELLQLHLLY